MDISMPVMTGIEATREIREHDPEARILILTGGSTVTELDQARTAGAAAYLTKDRIANDLIDQIRAWATSNTLLSSAAECCSGSSVFFHFIVSLALIVARPACTPGARPGSAGWASSRSLRAARISSSGT